MFTAEELDTLSKSLVANELLKKGSDTYYNFRKSMKNNKQPKTDMLAKLCLKLITQKTTLDPTLKSEYSEEFIEVMNSFPGQSYKDVIVIMKNNWINTRDNLKQQNELRYNYQQSNKELSDKVTELKQQISSLEVAISRLKNSDKTENIYY
tara:strand:+ start:244 stop:696 length:453 start_codon:yes stop_codon:yes gene_type:complete